MFSFHWMCSAMTTEQGVWQAWQTSQPVYSMARQKCREASGTFWTWTDQSITALTAWSKDLYRKDVADVSPSEIGYDKLNLTNISTAPRAISGDCWEMGQSAYRPFWALQCCLEWRLKLKLKLRTEWKLHAFTDWWIMCGSHNNQKWTEYFKFKFNK